MKTRKKKGAQLNHLKLFIGHYFADIFEYEIASRYFGFSPYTPSFVCCHELFNARRPFMLLYTLVLAFIPKNTYTNLLIYYLKTII